MITSGHNDLTNFYKTMFALQQHHGYPMTVVEEWMPYERDIYVALLIEFLDKEQARMKQNGSGQH